jgi:hypothetical protein
MKQNYYIQAAIALGEIEQLDGYGLDDRGIILLDGSVLPISDSVAVKAQYFLDLAQVRKTRDSLISDTDWIAYDDVPNSELKTAMLVYRQQLRDVTNQVIEGQLLEINWPLDPRVE